MFRYHDIFLSLGSNVGDRQENLQGAISLLDSHLRSSVASVSNFYTTEPLYSERQPDFLNCVVQMSTALEPEKLLELCFAIEARMGRRRGPVRYDPRPIDIDIVFFGPRMIRTDSLRIPHEKYSERKFVLIPLRDIAPDFICPDTGKTVKEMLRRCRDASTVERFLTTDMA